MNGLCHSVQSLEIDDDGRSDFFVMPFIVGVGRL
jgi:hypothetical protein